MTGFLANKVVDAGWILDNELEHTISPKCKKKVNTNFDLYTCIVLDTYSQNTNSSRLFKILVIVLIVDKYICRLHVVN